MTPIYLIDSGCAGTQSEDLQAELARQGFKFRIVKFFPQTSRPGDIVGAEMIPIDARVVFFGGPALLAHIQTHRRWLPGGWCTFPNFSCDLYYAYFGKFLLNGNYSILAASEAIRQADRLYDVFGGDGSVFVRPSVGRKLFTGTLADEHEFRTLLSRKIDPRTLVVVSSPKTIAREWRIYIANNEIVTSSQYCKNGELELSMDCPLEVIAFANEVLRSVVWRPDPLFTMDICESNGNLHLLELNGFSCSNLYASNLEAIVRATALAAQHT